MANDTDIFGTAGPAVKDSDIFKDLGPEKPAPQMSAKAPAPEAPSVLGRLARNVLSTAPIIGPVMAMGQANDILDKVAYRAGESATDLASQVLPPAGAAGVGTAANVAVQSIPMIFGGEGAKAAAPGMEAAGKFLMQSALKPTIEQLRTGKAARAIQTMLDEGFSVSKNGVEAMKAKIGDLNDEISNAISGSKAMIDKNKVAGYLQSLTNRFEKQVTPDADVKAVKSAWSEFMDHPAFAGLDAKGKELEALVEQKAASRAQALQDAGRFQTVAAQQEQLAHGGAVNLRGDLPRVPGQTMNEPYMNVGALGGRAISPQAYPVQGLPRLPGQYTQNADRVAEARQAAEDALKIAEQRRVELDQARGELAAHRASGGGGIPVQLAQQMKQGTYKALGDRAYGEQKGASAESQKTLARGLKDEISAAVPEVAAKNKRESDLINAAKLAERRVLMDANKNPLGLGILNPAMLPLWLWDRSPVAKSLVARGIYSGREQLPALAARTGIGALMAPYGQAPEDGVFYRR